MTTWRVTYDDGASRVVLAADEHTALIVASCISRSPARLVVRLW